MFEKEAEEYVMREDVITENDRVPFDNGYGFQIVSFEDEVKKGFQDGAEFGYNKANEILKSAVKVLISTLDDTLWDEGHPGYSDSEPGYKCPECACKDCYRVSCEYNKSELFKQLNTDFPELFKKGE